MGYRSEIEHLRHRRRLLQEELEGCRAAEPGEIRALRDEGEDLRRQLADLTERIDAERPSLDQAMAQAKHRREHSQILHEIRDSIRWWELGFTLTFICTMLFGIVFVAFGDATFVETHRDYVNLCVVVCLSQILVGMTGLRFFRKPRPKGL